MGRTPNFKQDDEKFGKFGEKDFKEWCEVSGWKYLDVSMEPLCQVADIDFFISKREIPPSLLTDSKELKELVFSKNTQNRSVFKVEVKCDTRSFETRNIVYEVIAHDFAGCCGETKADFVYYVFVDEDVNKKEAWMINLRKWREYLRTNFFGKIKELSYGGVVKDYGIKVNNFNTYGDCTANFLCNIEKLKEAGIAIKK